MKIDWWKIATTVIGAILVAVLLGWYNDYKDQAKQTTANTNRIQMLELEMRTNQKHTDEKLSDIQSDTRYIINVLDELR